MTMKSNNFFIILSQCLISDSHCVKRDQLKARFSQAKKVLFRIRQIGNGKILIYDVF